MDRRRTVAVAIALLGAAPALAQFQPVVMRMPAWSGAELAGGGWTSGTGPDLLILQTSGTGQGRLFPHQDLLTELASPYEAPASVHNAAVGAFDDDPAASNPDVAWNPSTSFDLAVTWEESATTFDTYTGVFGHWTDGMAAVRLLPRPQAQLLATAGKNGTAVASDLTAVDLEGSRGPPPVAPATRTWAVPAFASAMDGDSIDRIFPLQLSPGARAAGVDDALVPFRQGFFVLWHGATPGATDTLATADLVGVKFGTETLGGLGPYLPAELAATFDSGSCLGAATIDVDGDGVPDLVFSYSDVRWNTWFDPPQPGWLLWIHGADAATMSGQRPWSSLMGRPDLAAITDTGTLRRIELDSGEPAFAVQDRARERIVVVRGDGVSGFTTSELPTPGAYVQEMTTLDVVGSPARDLVALVSLAPAFTTWEVWVYPDVGDAAPSLAWSPPPPTVAPVGFDLPLSVAASDPDAPPLSLRWMGLPGGDVLDQSAVTVEGGGLCDPSSTLDVTVRAMDALGVYVTVSAPIALEPRPSLSIVGAEGAGSLVVDPGGASGVAAGEAWPRCGGTPTFDWGANGLPGILWGAPVSSGNSSQRDFTIPESSYADLLGGGASLTLRASDGGHAPPLDGTATLPLVPDARGLVSATVDFDAAALGPGELGTARVRLASRIGVPLPAVLARVRLAGLSFAGAMTVSGATATPGTGEGELVFDTLPPREATVEIRVPVRSDGTPGALSVELYSAGGFRVSPEAEPSAPDLLTPGCGCGGRGAASLPIALLLLAALSPRRRRPVT